jgi:hypothetical protein
MRNAHVKTGPLCTASLHAMVCAFGSSVRQPETHIKRQAAQHGCLPSLLGDRDKGTEIMYGKQKQLYWAIGPTRALKGDQKSLVPARQAQPTKEGALSFVLFESPFTSVSTVSRGYPSLVVIKASLGVICTRICQILCTTTIRQQQQQQTGQSQDPTIQSRSSVVSPLGSRGVVKRSPLVLFLSLVPPCQ